MKKEISGNELYRRINKYDIPCLYYHMHPLFDDEGCGYYDELPDCQKCICQGGSINPKTGKRVYKRKDKSEW